MVNEFFKQEEILPLLRKGDNKVFEYFYKTHFRVVATLVMQNHGNEDDARELFQDTMIVLFKKVRDNADFVLSAQWSTFIYAIARNLWLRKLSIKKQNPIISIEDTMVLEQIPNEMDLESQELQYEQKHNLVKNTLATLKKECREIIEAAFYKKLSGIEIARLLGYTEDFVKVKKFRCMKELRMKVGLQ
jgi:RNA polymerase sigma factor (sigma-70 family)